VVSQNFTEFLDTDPEFAAAASEKTAIIVRDRDGFIEAELSGVQFAGSERTFLAYLDIAITNTAIEDEGDVPLLLVTLLRHNKRRLILVGGEHQYRTLFAVWLLDKGAAFETDGFAFITPLGLKAHPLKCRVGVEFFNKRFLPAAAMEQARSAFLGTDHRLFAIDPSFNGIPWRVDVESDDVFVFVDYNEGGRPLFIPMAFQDALKQMMQSVCGPRKIDVLKLAAIHKLLHQKQFYRLTIGRDFDATSQVFLEKLSTKCLTH
jgi:hypothetical protein